MRRPTLLAACLIAMCCSAAEPDSFTVEGPHQRGALRVQVLAPRSGAPGERLPLVLVLPVEAGGGTRFGDAMAELAALDAAERLRALFALPEFADEPWAAEHPRDPARRQASHLRLGVLPELERRHPALRREPAGRLLFGFSKGGWAAFSLLARFPGDFAAAASWDAPLLLDGLHWGMESAFGDRAAFDTSRPDRLLAADPTPFRLRRRLVLAGERAWGTMIPPPGGGSHTAGFHALLMQQGIDHAYLPDLPCEHRWDRRWMEPVLTAALPLVR